MIYRLRYCNKDGVEARVDIQKGSSTPVIDVEGTERPFILSYNNDKGNKSGMFLSSSADIEIYETADFNIDNLKTSNETELSVTHYINNIVSWRGFIIPDFFSIEVRNNPVITMTASDRLGTLKNVTLSDLPSMISLRELAILCLNKTGLTLPLRTMADFSNGAGTNDFFNSKVLTQRLSDTKGRSISCYDILSSILTASNSFLVQRSGGWHIINKIQHEAGSGKLYTGATSFINWSDVIFNFSDISIGGRRTIIPVASTVGVFHEFGGGRIYPENYDFSLDLTGWTSVNGFVSVIDNRKVDNFVSGTGIISQEWTTDPVFGDPTEKKYLVNDNYGINYDFADKPYLRSSNIPVTYPNISQVKVNVEVNATGPYIDSETYRGETNFAVIASNGTSTLHLTGSGTFETLSGDPFLHKVLFDGDTHLQAVTSSRSVNGVLAVQDGNLSGYNITVRIYGYTKGVTGGRFLVTTLVNSVAVTITDISDEAKGILYKTERTDNYTKAHDIDTSLFADYLTTGLNGYFYSFPIDDTSLIYNSNNELTSKWTAYNDPEQLPLLQHITRQRSRLFSVAHDILSAEIEVNNFDPLAIFVACEKRYTVVSAQFDFFKSNLSVELEEVAFQSANVRDFIYSYFGEGEDNIKSIGGISAGASGGAGIDSGLIGGINERIDDVNDKVNNIKVGPANLLLNTGFLGDFQSLTVDALTAVTGNTPINTNPLAHWVYSNTEVVDAPSRSGKGIKIGSIQQTVTLKQGSHVLSFWAKGNSLTVDLVESVPVSIDSEYKKYSFDITVANPGAYTFSLSGDAYIYEIMLSEGNAEVSYSYSEEDDLKAIAQIQAINVITEAIKNYDTDILGGLILTSMIQLGKYKDGVMEKVNAGINGIYNNDNDPAFWAGGSFEDAIRTVQKFIDNPNYEPTEAEWAEMANIVFTHGGDGFFRGYVYALGGIFRGRIESSSNGRRIIIDPSESSIVLLDEYGNVTYELSFDLYGEDLYHPKIKMRSFEDQGATTLGLLELTADGINLFDPDTGLISTSYRRGNLLITETTGEQIFEVIPDFGGRLHVLMKGLNTGADGLIDDEVYKDENGFLKVKQ